MVYVITNRKLALNMESYFHIIKVCFENNVEALVIREKDLPENDLEALCKKILSLRNEVNENSFCINNSITNVIMNSNIKLAKRYALDGVQLSYDKFVNEYKAKKNIDFQGRLGVSVHSVEEALDAFKRNADYVIVGHIFETKCKEGLIPRGLDIIQSIRGKTKKHIVAIGGINESNYKSVINSGADSIAMMSEIMCCNDIDNFLNKIC